jgi:hypothetical protein
MEGFKGKENTISKIYGNEDLKEIITDLLEKTFIKEIENIENCSNQEGGC